MSATFKASLLVGLCAIFALWVISVRLHDTVFIAQALFYVLFLLQTFFSVRLFQALAPTADIVQGVLDTLLVALFFLIAYHLGMPVLFPLFVTVIFALAVVKYRIMRRTFPHQRLMRRKIFYNQLGTLLGLAATLTAYAGLPSLAAWGMTIVFAVATFYLFLVNPLYRI